VTFTDQAQQLCDDASFEAMCATLGTWRVLAASAAPVSHTGDALETALATIAIPAGAMGPNGQLRVTTQWSYTNSANNKTLRVRFGGTSGTSYLAQTSTATASAVFQNRMANRGAANSQVGNSNTAFGASAAAIVTSAVDTDAAVNLVLAAQLANAGENVTLESYLIELFHGA
jgi:hypothetical protein